MAGERSIYRGRWQESVANIYTVYRASTNVPLPLPCIIVVELGRFSHERRVIGRTKSSTALEHTHTHMRDDGPHSLSHNACMYTTVLEPSACLSCFACFAMAGLALPFLSFPLCLILTRIRIQMPTNCFTASDPSNASTLA